MKIKCVNNKNYENRLTVGKTYEVVRARLNLMRDDYFVEVIGSDGNHISGYRHRFNITKEEVKDYIFKVQNGVNTNLQQLPLLFPEPSAGLY